MVTATTGGLGNPAVSVAEDVVSGVTTLVSVIFPAIAAFRLAKRLFAGHPGAADACSDTRLPGAFVNRMLLGVMRTEDRLLRTLSLPFGTSVLVTARRPVREAGA